MWNVPKTPNTNVSAHMNMCALMTHCCAWFEQIAVNTTLDYL